MPRLKGEAFLRRQSALLVELGRLLAGKGGVLRKDRTILDSSKHK